MRTIGPGPIVRTWAAALLLGGCGASTDPVAPAAPATWSPAADRLALGEEPAYAHVRFTKEGALAWRHVEREQRRWEDGGSWSLGGTTAGVGRAFGALRRALQGFAAEVRLREPDGASRIRLILEAGSEVPWLHLGGVLQVAAHPRVRIWRVSFLSPHGSDSVGIDLPRDRSGPSSIPSTEPLRQAVFVRVKLFRKDKAGPAPWTRVRLRASPAVATDDGEFLPWDDPPFEGPRPHRRIGAPAGDAATGNAPRSPGDPAETVPYDARPGEEEDAWRRVEDAIRGHAAEAPLLYGEVVLPPPDGPAVPYGDVWRILRALRDAGALRIGVESLMPDLVEVEEPPSATPDDEAVRGADDR